MREAIKSSGFGQQLQKAETAWNRFRDRQEAIPTKGNLFTLMQQTKRVWHDQLHVVQLDDMVDKEGNSVVVNFSKRSHTLGYLVNGRHVSEDAGRSVATELTVDQPVSDTGISIRTQFVWDDHGLTNDMMDCKVSTINTASQKPLSRHQHATIFRGRRPDGLSDAWFPESESSYPRYEFTDEQLQLITARAYQVAFNQLRRRVPVVEYTLPQLPSPNISRA